MHKPLYRCVLTLTALLAFAPPAHAVTLITPTGAPSDLQRLADLAKVPTVDETLTLYREPCPKPVTTACTYQTRAAIWLSHDEQFTRLTLLHELGHRFDYRVLTDQARTAFMRLAHTGGAWRTADDTSPHEKFADAYSLCARYKRAIGPGEYPGLAVASVTGYRVGIKGHRRVCRLIRLAAAGFYGHAGTTK